MLEDLWVPCACPEVTKSEALQKILPLAQEFYLSLFLRPTRLQPISALQHNTSYKKILLWSPLAILRMFHTCTEGPLKCLNCYVCPCPLTVAECGLEQSIFGFLLLQFLSQGSRWHSLTVKHQGICGTDFNQAAVNSRT